MEFIPANPPQRLFYKPISSSVFRLTSLEFTHNQFCLKPEYRQSLLRESKADEEHKFYDCFLIFLGTVAADATMEELSALATAARPPAEPTSLPKPADMSEISHHRNRNTYTLRGSGWKSLRAQIIGLKGRQLEGYAVGTRGVVLYAVLFLKLNPQVQVQPPPAIDDLPEPEIEGAVVSDPAPPNQPAAIEDAASHTLSFDVYLLEADFEKSKRDIEELHKRIIYLEHQLAEDEEIKRDNQELRKRITDLEQQLTFFTAQQEGTGAEVEQKLVHGGEQYEEVYL